MQNSVLIIVQKAVGVVFMLRLETMQYSSFPQITMMFCFCMILLSGLKNNNNIAL